MRNRNIAEYQKPCIIKILPATAYSYQRIYLSLWAGEIMIF